MNLRNERFTRDESPIDPRCGCVVCEHYSRAYLRHLFKAGEVLGPRLLTYHNLHFYLRLLQQCRAAIARQEFEEFRRSFLGTYRDDDFLPD